MSDTDTTTRKKPAEATAETVTDSLGRVLTFKRLDALAELDLIEAAGSNSENRRWMMMATVAACVRDIDGIPCGVMTNKLQIRAQVQKVGSEGIAAVLAALAPEEQAAAALDDGDAAAVVAGN